MEPIPKWQCMDCFAIYDSPVKECPKCGSKNIRQIQQWENGEWKKFLKAFKKELQEERKKEEEFYQMIHTTNEEERRYLESKILGTPYHVGYWQIALSFWMLVFALLVIWFSPLFGLILFGLSLVFFAWGTLQKWVFIRNFQRNLFYALTIAPDEAYSPEIDIANDETQPSLATKKYVEWYRKVLIFLVLLGPVEVDFSPSTTGYNNSLLRSTIELLLMTVSIIGLVKKKKWGPIFVMIWSVYLILYDIWFAINSLTSIVDILVALMIPSSFIIFQFVIALKEYKQLGNIGTKGGFNK